VNKIRHSCLTGLLFAPFYEFLLGYIRCGRTAILFLKDFSKLAQYKIQNADKKHRPLLTTMILPYIVHMKICRRTAQVATLILLCLLLRRVCRPMFCFRHSLQFQGVGGEPFVAYAGDTTSEIVPLFAVTGTWQT
jgi:hypothetical protein